MKALSTREQLDVLIMAMEHDLDLIREYSSDRDEDSYKATPASLLYVHNHGMARGAEFAEEILSNTLNAAKMERKRQDDVHD